MNNDRTVDPATLNAANAFVDRVSAHYPVSRAILFGSRARGRFTQYSDADIAVVLRGHPSKFLTIKLAMADIAYDVLLETGIRIQPLPIWEEEWDRPESYPNPHLLQNIHRDGIRL